MHDIDTPEHGQKCKKANGGSWRCGSNATKALQAIVAGKSVKCDNRGIDDYGRIIAVCTDDGININEALIRDGFAVKKKRLMLVGELPFGEVKPSTLPAIADV